MYWVGRMAIEALHFIFNQGNSQAAAAYGFFVGEKK